MTEMRTKRTTSSWIKSQDRRRSVNGPTRRRMRVGTSLTESLQRTSCKYGHNRYTWLDETKEEEDFLSLVCFVLGRQSFLRPFNQVAIHSDTNGFFLIPL